MDEQSKNEPLRSAAVAGRFYPGTGDDLRREVNDLLAGCSTPSDAPARLLIVPHAGYIYSGAIAAEAFGAAAIPDRVIILSPNHTGLGPRISIMAEGSWQLPGQDAHIDGQLAQRLLSQLNISADSKAHMREHSIEVQLPFLLARNRAMRFVPITLGPLDQAQCAQVAAALTEVLEDASAEGPVLLVASTDMSHYIPAAEAARLDGLALDRALALDGSGLHAVVTDNEITMCGFVPTTIALMVAKSMGAAEAKLLRYGHSGQVTGDDSQVVAYAALLVR